MGLDQSLLCFWVEALLTFAMIAEPNAVELGLFAVGKLDNDICRRVNYILFS